MAMMIAGGITCELRHGIKMELYQEPGKLTVQMVGDFLAKAMEHFGRMKLDRREKGLFCLTFSKGRGRNAIPLATIQVSYTPKAGEPPLTADLWTNAVIRASSIIHSVEGMLERLAAWKQALAAPGQSVFLRSVVDMLEEPEGDLKAMQALLKDSLERDLKDDLYKPGQVVDVLEAAKAMEKHG